MSRKNATLSPAVGRIARASTFNHFKSFREILQFLVQSLNLDEASFCFLAPSGGRFFQKISSSSHDHFKPFDAQLSALQESCLAERKPVDDGATLNLPVFLLKQNLGLLTLAGRELLPLAADLVEELQSVCAEMAPLAQHVIYNGRGEKQAAKLTLLSELGRVLGKARTIDEALSFAAKALRTHAMAEAVFVRPLLGGTVFGPRREEISPTSVSPLSVLYDLEETFSSKVTASGKIIVRQLPKAKGDDLPLVVAGLPMRFQGRFWGVLTIFYRQRDMQVLPSKAFFNSVASQVALAIDRLTNREDLEVITSQDRQKLKEMLLLNQISRAMHSRLGVNELIHLILSVAALPSGGGFERAILLTHNERTGVLQGMLGITKRSASLALPSSEEGIDWDRLDLRQDIRDAQKRTSFCRTVLKQRLHLDASTNSLARAILEKRVLFVHRPLDEPQEGRLFAESLNLTPYACAPLLGRDRPLGVLVVDNPSAPGDLPMHRLRFLELFAHQAGNALENANLINRLESAHRDLKETQERLIQGEKMAVLGQMAASVAHELKNPLTSVGGFAQRLVRRTDPGTEEHEYAGIIAHHVRRLEDMLNNILGFSKKQMLCFSSFRISDAIDECIDLERSALSAQEVLLQVELPEALPLLQGDRKKLQQVLLNLMANARQAMSLGGTLTLKAYRTLLRGEKAVAIEVRDTGGGIPQEILRNIFNPFFTTKDEGTGLGLSISHRIIELHRGEIEILNTEDGALFIVRLPLKGDQQPIDKSS